MSANLSEKELETRLMEYQHQLHEMMEDTQADLEFFRLRRAVWNDWAGLIEFKRQYDLVQTLRLHGPDPSNTLEQNEETIPDIFNDLPDCFEELQASLDYWLGNHDLLEEKIRALPEAG